MHPILCGVFTLQFVNYMMFTCVYLKLEVIDSHLCVMPQQEVVYLVSSSSNDSRFVAWGTF